MQVSIDPDRLAQAIQNLVQNAVQYTQPGGKVIVTAWVSSEKIQLQVIDNGSGIAMNEQDLVWKPFYRGSNQGRFPLGMGLGLSIAHDIVIAHGGEIALVSAPAEGSTFTISLPCFE